MTNRLSPVLIGTLIIFHSAFFYSSEAKGQITRSDKSNFILNEDCLGNLNGTGRDPEIYFRCAANTKVYAEIDKVISSADALPMQTERINLLAHANAELGTVLNAVSDELTSIVAKSFAMKFGIEIEKLAEFLKTPEALDLTDIDTLVVAQKWESDYVDDNDRDGLFAEAIVATNQICTSPTVAAKTCKLTIEEVNRLAVLAGIAKRINSVFRSLAYDPSKAKSEKFVSRWRTLENVAPFQYPWELFLNRRFLNCRLFNPKRERYENTAGILTSVPNCHLIALHPDVGFGYSPDAVEGSRTTEALVLEMGGFVVNRFKSDRDADIWGGSLAATFADLNGNGNNLGFGVTLRYNNFALTISEHDDLTFFYFNLELFDRFGKSKKAYEEFRDKY